MGKKVDPNVIRIGIIKTWPSKWYAQKKKFAKFLHLDLKIRKHVEKKLNDAMIGSIEILRSANNVVINIFTAKPGVIIGKGGELVEQLKDELEKMTGDKFLINVKEIKKPMLNARLVAETIAKQIEKRGSYRKAIKMSLDKVMEAGALGVKVYAAGRLNGVEISRGELYSKGKIPLQTLRANIDYATYPARTTYGTIGIKVWIYKGMVFKKKSEAIETTLHEQ